MKEKYLFLKKIQDTLIENVDIKFKRDVFDTINWDEEVIGIIWERWVGKTTIMLQKIKETWVWFYFSADNPIVKDLWLFKFVFFLYDELGINIFYIDEIHKYPDWINEVKSIYDSLIKKNIVFSGSSSLDLYKWIIDLWRRVSFYKIHTLNFSEYLKLFHTTDVPSFTLDQILNNHNDIALKYWNEYKQERWSDFILKWQYPYLKNTSSESFISKFQILLDKVILEDIPVFLNMQTISLDKIRKIFYFITNTPLSNLSFTNLWQKIWVDKSIIENVLMLLHKIWIISLIPKFWNLSDRIRKEYKILLGNTNLYSAYNINTDIWILRESFFVSCIRKVKNVEIFLPSSWDFIVEIYDKKYYFEVWGKSKNRSKYWENTIIIKDSIRISDDNKVIPLWIFGLL